MKPALKTILAAILAALPLAALAHEPGAHVHGIAKLQVAVDGNTLTLGTGVDGLQEVCAHAIICEPSWVPGENVQCFDRLDRGGQRHTVYGEILVAPNSLSEGILAAALHKMRPISQALDRKED